MVGGSGNATDNDLEGAGPGPGCFSLKFRLARILWIDVETLVLAILARDLLGYLVVDAV